MSGKMISLAGEVHISTGNVYTTVDALEALKAIGIAYGLYSRAEESQDQRVMRSSRRPYSSLASVDSRLKSLPVISCRGMR